MKPVTFLPTTSLPSSVPTMTGLVLKVDVNKANVDMTPQEIADFRNMVADTYSVPVDDVKVELLYEIDGTMKLDNIPENISTEEMEAILQKSIAENLGKLPKLFLCFLALKFFS